MEQNDEDLQAIMRIRDGDESGLVDLMRRYKDAVFRLAIRFTGNHADATELAEETFFRVYSHAARYRPKAKVRTWVFAIATNLCRDHFRRNAKRRRDASINVPVGPDSETEAGEFLADSEADPAERMLSRESIDAIDAEIRKLPDKLKLPLILCALEDHSYDECAAMLKTSRKTVEMRIYRARQMLKAALGR